MFERFFDRPLVVPALIGSVALIIGLALVGAGFAARSSNTTISVTGSATQDVTADEATWRIDVRRTAPDGGTADAYAQIAKDGATVKGYFDAQKLASSTVTQSVISTDQDYKQSDTAPLTYTVHETIVVQTSDVNAIDKLSRSLNALSSQISFGTLLQPQAPEYYVSSLPQLRVSLAGKAIEDAKARAVEIAKSGGSTVGALASASSGVVQVLAPNSTNIEDYGSYDTSTIQKQVMVTARASFYVR